MLYKKVRKFLSRSRYGTIIATLFLDRHSLGLCLPPGSNYGYSLSILSNVRLLVNTWSFPKSLGGISGHNSRLDEVSDDSFEKLIIGFNVCVEFEAIISDHWWKGWLNTGY